VFISTFNVFVQKSTFLKKIKLYLTCLIDGFALPLHGESRQGAEPVRLPMERGGAEGLGAMIEPEILTFSGMISWEINFLTAFLW